jgi:long-chain fatty acid transport protein
MSKGGLGVRAAGALCVLAIAAGSAQAGGFAIREQSAYGMGSAFAGIAAGGALSSMFWNPATMTQVPGIQSESVISGIFPYSAHTVDPSSTFAAFGSAGNSGLDALVPGSYMSMQIMPKMWIGLSVNSPFGLAVRFPDAWAGRTYAEDTRLETYNATPSIAYEVNDWLSLGAGVQIQYAHADVAFGLPINGFGVPPGLGQLLSIEGNGWGFGATLGATLKPTPTTTVGIGWRSALNQDINGSLTLPPGPVFTAPVSTPGSVSTTLKLPDVVSLGVRQQIGPQWTLLGTIEWTNWSRIGTSNVNQPSGTVATVAGVVPVTLPFQYSDGWFFSAGAEYKYNDRLSLRAGVAYEISPITDQVRTPRLPDNDRIWLALGGSYQLTPRILLDAAYTHIFVRDTPINITATSGNPWFIPGVTGNYVGSVDSHVDIVSVGLHYRWDTPAPPPQKKLLITK